MPNSLNLSSITTFALEPPLPHGTRVWRMHKSEAGAYRAAEWEIQSWVVNPMFNQVQTVPHGDGTFLARLSFRWRAVVKQVSTHHAEDASPEELFATREELLASL